MTTHFLRPLLSTATITLIVSGCSGIVPVTMQEGILAGWWHGIAAGALDHASNRGAAGATDPVLDAERGRGLCFVCAAFLVIAALRLLPVCAEHGGLVGIVSAASMAFVHSQLAGRASANHREAGPDVGGRAGAGTSK
jgi:hypothetical protein